jgi:hypothetical protein
MDKLCPTQTPLILTNIPLQIILDEIRNIIQTEIRAQREEELRDRLLSGAEACKLFQPVISKVTLKNWGHQGLIANYRIGGRVFYKYSDVMESLKSLKKYKKPIVQG